MGPLHILSTLGQQHEFLQIPVPEEVGLAEPATTADGIDVGRDHLAQLLLIIDV